MNKNLLYTALCATALSVTVSCGTSSSKDGKGNAAAYENKSAESASHVIEYTNLLIDIANKHNDYITRLAENVDKIEKGLKNPSDRFAFIGIISPSFFPRFNSSKLKPEQPVDELSSADQKFFKEKYTSYNAAFEKLQGNYKLLQDYLKAEDYKDDKSVKGLALVDSIRSNAETLMAEKAVLMKKVNEIADASEAVVLKDSPLKEYIIAMKADMKAVRDYVELMEEGGANYNTIKDKAQTAYAALEKAQSEHSQLNMDNAKKENKDGSYKLFYDRFHDILLDAKKTMREAGEKGQLTDSQLDNLNRNYDYLIERYNSFNS